MNTVRPITSQQTQSAVSTESVDPTANTRQVSSQLVAMGGNIATLLAQVSTTAQSLDDARGQLESAQGAYDKAKPKRQSDESDADFQTRLNDFNNGEGKALLAQVTTAQAAVDGLERLLQQQQSQLSMLRKTYDAVKQQLPLAKARDEAAVQQNASQAAQDQAAAEDASKAQQNINQESSASVDEEARRRLIGQEPRPTAGLAIG